MADFGAILSGILGGVGQAGTALAAERQRAEELARQKVRDALLERQVGLAERQYEGGMVEMPVEAIPSMFRPAGATGSVRLPRETAALYAQLGMKEREKTEDLARRNVVAGTLERGTPGQVTEPLQPGEDPEAAAFVPRTPNVAASPRDRQLAAFMRAPGLEKLAEFLLPKERYIPIEGAIYDTSRDEFKRPPAGPAFVPPAGYAPKQYTVSPTNKVSTVYATPDPIKERQEARRERMDAITLGLMEKFVGAGTAGGGAAQLEPSVSLGPGGARIGLSRTQLGEEDKKALRAYDNILAAVNELDTFSEEEIGKYAGLLNRGARDVKQFLGTIPGLEGLSDERYAHFRALAGRLTGTAFAEGGKQLTPFEAGVVFTYTPTGKEVGGPTEFKAKKNQLGQYTLLRRQLVARYAERGINPATVPNEVWDQQIREGMTASGLAVPKATPQSPATPAVPGGWKIERVK